MATLTGGEFVGRQQEMGKLKGVLEDALSGRGQLLMLVGEPGIGKTRTAQELAAHAETRGAQVLWGWCYEEAGAPPYWPWVQPLRSYIQQVDPERLRAEMGPGAANIAEVLPEVKEKLPDLQPLSTLEPEQARFRLFDSITAFLKNASQTQSLCCWSWMTSIGRTSPHCCYCSSWPGNWVGAVCWWWAAIEMWSYPRIIPFPRLWPSFPGSRCSSGRYSEA
jgi:AAA ATPase domain